MTTPGVNGPYKRYSASTPLSSFKLAGIKYFTLDYLNYSGMQLVVFAKLINDRYHGVIQKFDREWLIDESSPKKDKFAPDEIGLEWELRVGYGRENPRDAILDGLMVAKNESKHNVPYSYTITGFYETTPS